MKKQAPFILWLYRLACWLLAAVCMIYLSLILVDYLQTDPIGYLPAVGQWLIGLFLTCMLFVTRKGLQQLLNVIWLTGLAGLVAIF